MKDTSNLMTPSAFARHLGYKPHYGTQLKNDGRLVMAPDGKHVLVAESKARFEATKDPSKQGVADRHAAGRAASTQVPTKDASPAAEQAAQLTENESTQQPSVFNFQDSKAEKEFWEAKTRKAEYLKLAGELMPLAHHVAAMADVGATVRSKLEAWASTLSPQLAMRDEPAVRAMLVDQVEQMLHSLEDLIARKSTVEHT